MGHAVTLFGTPSADGGVTPATTTATSARTGAAPGSYVDEAEGGILQVIDAPTTP